VLASWLACKSRCVLGDADLAIDLPVSADVAARAGRLAAEAAGRLPVGSLDEVVTAQKVLGGLEQGADTGTVSIWLSWETPPSSVELFPAPDERLVVRNVTAQTRGSLSRLDATVELQGPQRPERLETVVAVTHDGRRSGYRLVIPLDPEARRAAAGDG
jgi:DsbC/DsbD-like thiol-disulfide interchange protein